MNVQQQRGSQRRPDLDSLFSINPDGSRNMLQPEDVHGRWHTRRQVLFALLIAIYLAAPWIRIGGAPALRLDLPERTAYVLGQSFTREDFFLVFFLITGFGFTLFALTALYGRVWCGYACPQTVFLEGVFRRVERWIEGSRNQRLKRNKGPLSFDKLWRKSLKHLLFALLALAIAHVLLAYFLPVEELLPALLRGPREHWTAFGWTMALAGLVYFDLAWFREQFCVILCPYGRLQSALIDDATVNVGYDEKRGEPRGPKGRATGDCIDCFSCVNVCPTGIDIRNGLQMECVGCANCIDACDSIMRQIGRPTGLVRYASLKELRGERSKWLRPRVFLYAGLALVGLAVFLGTAAQRTSFEATVLRAQGMPYTLLEDRSIQNLFTLHLQNKSLEAARYRIAPLPASSAGEPAVHWTIASPEVELEPLGESKIPIFTRLPFDAWRTPFPLRFSVQCEGSDERAQLEVNFRGP